jgi:hypothetical protein
MARNDQDLKFLGCNTVTGHNIPKISKDHGALIVKGSALQSSFLSDCLTLKMGAQNTFKLS